MRFAIITHSRHKRFDGRYFGYGPYVREMNIWGAFADELEVVGPLRDDQPDKIDLAYSNPNLKFTKIPAIDLLGTKALLRALFALPIIVWEIFWAMKRADHIHLRCPGNIGLVGCFVQMLFPSKNKTAKYAGNWDPDSAQPLSYRLQKWLLNNTFLTRNMKVLVYGDWPGNSSNILPFFTATYKDSDKCAVIEKTFDFGINVLFVGSLAPGKRPLYAVQVVEALLKSGASAKLALYGEGSERPALESYIRDNGLERYIEIKGNRNEADVREAYQNAHFLILASKSEGWPKVVAEAMFWKTVPLATEVSCVPWMMGEGTRGVLLELDAMRDAQKVLELVQDPQRYLRMANAAMQWSRLYTLDRFQNEIKKLLYVEK